MSKPVRSPSALRWRKSEDIAAEVSIITHVYGGGAVSSEDDHPQQPTRNLDPVTPLRGTSVRGHLRFWWRALYGCRTNEMFKRECELWGSPALEREGKPVGGPGLVNLVIAQKGRFSATSVPVPTELKYGAFSAKNLWRVTGNADVRLVVDSTDNGVIEEVRNAFTAWLLFGGIGGRTRRGFGAVHAAKLPSIESFLKKFAAFKSNGEISSLLGASFKLGKPSKSIEDAHKAAVQAMYRFRQQQGFARNEGKQAGHPGRSRWPEPDTIRRVTRQGAPEHRPQHPVQAFPRAAFGMPILFHFRDRGEPRDQTLLPSDHERMGSPLILRPTFDGQSWRPMVLRLNTPLHIKSLRLNKNNLSPINGIIRSAQEAAAIYPLAQQGNETDVLKAFMQYFSQTA